MFNIGAPFEPAQYAPATQSFQAVLARSTVAPQLLLVAVAPPAATPASVVHLLHRVALVASGK
jgi:hypothetical protein